LGFGTKFTSRIFIVILLMVVGMCVTLFVLYYQSSRMKAFLSAEAAMMKLEEECLLIKKRNTELAEAISQDPAIISALANKSRKAAAEDINSIVKVAGGPGDLTLITLIDGDGKVFCATGTPKFLDYSVAGSWGVHHVMSKFEAWQGYTTFSPQGRISQTSLAPVLTNNHFKGIVGVSQPLSSEFLKALTAKLAVEDKRMSGIDIVIVAAQTKPNEQPQVAISPELRSTDNPFVMNLIKSGEKGLPQPVIDLRVCAANQFLPFCTSQQSFESGGRWWYVTKVNNGSGEHLGIVLTSKNI
jgi:hypothetical protein